MAVLRLLTFVEMAPQSSRGAATLWLCAKIPLGFEAGAMRRGRLHFTFRLAYPLHRQYLQGLCHH
jgi:hypothetical protein